MKKLFGKTQIEISKEVGVCQSHISALLNGKKAASAEVALKLESVTGWDARYFMAPSVFDRNGEPLTKQAKNPTPTTQEP
ncbi:helix-turn-helix domain-containing protein, partial [Desulfovibrio sp. OttesenSCG-928-G15]|nr:helix-turn-helix domain-containing protein [Desulfovibrio sp. OttesenSCG-928-G15]